MPGVSTVIRLWSTCNACGEAMRVWEEFPEYQNSHPVCPDTPDFLQRIDRRMQEAIRAERFDELDTLDAEAEAFLARPLKHLDAALLYAAWGWPVFPLKPGSKEPATRNGFKDAVTDAATVRGWWSRSPKANIGIATGHTFDVIDVDIKDDGIRNWTLDVSDRVDKDVHGWNRTPSGGFHVLIEPSGGGNLTKVLPGIDYRGLGGYIVAPPSALDEYEGRRYRWSVKPSPVIKRS